jgi:hypothetical protein
MVIVAPWLLQFDLQLAAVNPSLEALWSKVKVAKGFPIQVLSWKKFVLVTNAETGSNYELQAFKFILQVES